MPEELVLADGEEPKKLENFLKKRFPIGYVRKLFRKTGIRLNGRPAKPDEFVRGGDRIAIFIPFEVTPGSGRRDVALEKLKIVFEDDSLVVIDKPAGLAVHEGKTVTRHDSVIGQLERRYRNNRAMPKLVHRLDKDTSGLMLVAKSAELARDLERRFDSGGINKEYRCLVAGRLPQRQGAIDFPLPGRQGAPVSAHTRFKVERRFSQTTLLRVRIATGRMHQIRLHFAKLGYPIVMDDQHGDFSYNKRFRKEYGLKRQFLHASALTLEYRGKMRSWSAPLPADLKRTLDLLGGA